MHATIRSLLALLAFAALTSLAHAQDSQETICSNAWVIFCDNFETREPGFPNSGDLTRPIFKNPGWQGSGGHYVTAGEGFDGSRAMRVDYAPRGPGVPPNPGDPANGGAGYIVATYTTNAKTLYWRWYTKWSTNWKRSPAAEKHLILQYGNGPQNQGLHAGHSGFGSPPTHMFISHVDTTYVQNEGRPHDPVLGQWYCYEARVTLGSSATTKDGAIEFWADGQRILNHPNIRTTFYDNMVHFQTLFSAYYNCADPTCQSRGDAHPMMTRWHDNFVVGTQRIGCLGSAGS